MYVTTSLPRVFSVEIVALTLLVSGGITGVYFLPQIHHGMRPGRVVQRFVDRRRLVIQQLLQFAPGNILLVLQIIATLLIGIKREVNEAREGDIFDIAFGHDANVI
ncbi:hypothetical protein F25303_8024 [Fusarium sp. NRRL 25303]|nr:hypothetical protein F25303_8024 [Fusarium sp. NRRL 25303]